MSSISAADYFRAAAISGASAVLLGAFGAHSLKGRVSADSLTVWSTASQYHLVHAAALAAAALSRGRGSSGGLPCALLAAGTAVFSGSLYLLVLTGRRALGAVTPIGGLLLAAGWLTLAWEAPAALAGRP